MRILYARNILCKSVPTLGRAVQDTRREAGKFMVDWNPAMASDHIDRVLLIVEELVAHTIEHAAKGCMGAQFRLVIDDGSLTVAVHDRNLRHPRVPHTTRATGKDGWRVRVIGDLVREAGGSLMVRTDPDRQGKTVVVSLPW